MYMTKKIKQPFFGNIFFHTKQNTKQNQDITQLQKIDFYVRNEITMKKLIESILNYDSFFKTISPEGEAQLKKTKHGLFIDNDYAEGVDDQYILLNIPSESQLYFDSFIFEPNMSSKHILHLFESFHYIATAIEILYKQGIIHFDIRPTHIMIDSNTHTPRIAHFKKSIAIGHVTLEKLKPYFKTTAFSIKNNEIWPLEVYAIHYFLWISPVTKQENSFVCTKQDIDAIIQLYIQTNKLHSIYSETQLNQLNQQCCDFLLKFESFKKETIIKQLFNNWKSWDLYSISYMYCNICNILCLKTKNAYFIFILKSFFSILCENLHPNPKKRLSLAETQTKINHILFQLQ